MSMDFLDAHPAVFHVLLLVGFTVAWFLAVVFLTPVMVDGKPRTLLRGFLVDLPVAWWRARRRRLATDRRER